MKFLQITILLSTFLLSVSYAKNHNNYYNKKLILKETKWKNMSVQYNAPIHLSVISQGYFDEELHGKYDKNYYYPSSAGKGIDVFMFDNGFSLDYDEFSDIDAHLDALVIGGKVIKPTSDKEYHNITDPILDHGTLTSAAVAGKILGVAKKANIHAIYIDEYNANNDFIDNLIAGLNYMKNEHKFKSHKTVVNLSVGTYVTIDEFKKGKKIKKAQKLINNLSEEGVVFVACADNKGKYPYDKASNSVLCPCSFDNVICVGGVGNFSIPGIMNDEIDKSYYTIGKYEKNDIHVDTNYGDHVDIYAPYVYHYQGDIISDKNTLFFGIIPSNYEVEETEYGLRVKDVDVLVPGTSISSPIVAGVAATLMSENPKEKFTTKKMLKRLKKLSEKNIIDGVSRRFPNYFINNGKKIIFDANA